MADHSPAATHILSQTGQIPGSTFHPQAVSYAPQPAQKKNYVFVVEHNRHKRLKVMRACEGCRKRKIKCDSATTNTWPCSPCVRLKLHCVRPNESASTDTSTFSAQSPSQLLPQPLQQQVSQLQQPLSLQHPSLHPLPQLRPLLSQQQQQQQQPQAPYGEFPTDFYQAIQFSNSSKPSPNANPPANLDYSALPTPLSSLGPSYTAPASQFTTPSPQSSTHSHGSQSTQSQPGLAELLGSLKVDEAGTAPYLRNKAFLRQEELPVEEDNRSQEFELPITVRRGKIRIPPELMPSDGIAHRYFDLYFTHIHPYLPVLNKTLFYQQWKYDRDNISPLVLEAMFSIGGKLADEPAQGQQWLSLASKHADAFMDVPRLSTLQALLMIMKAREAAPQKGYFYRSWMSIVQIVQMGKDLGLDEHYNDHQVGEGCGSSMEECVMKTRIWQTVFVLETMIGSPQGRTDLAVKVDSVDFSTPSPRSISSADDNSDTIVGGNFTMFARLVRNVSIMNTVYAQIKKKKDWGVDPKLVQLNPTLHAWLRELPSDLVISFPPDGSPPYLPSAFVGNLHTYHYLTFILLHRPQLAFCDPSGQDGRWKQHMVICYSSAKAICRIQEGILKQFGILGLQYMLRGLSFPVYCGLSCIILHLVAMTSPDPDLRMDAADYFTRHMRILEGVIKAWPMPEIQKQIDAVREAFSADTRRPFVLKPSFPYSSPSSSHSSPSQLSSSIFQQQTPVFASVSAPTSSASASAPATSLVDTGNSSLSSLSYHPMQGNYSNAMPMTSLSMGPSAAAAQSSLSLDEVQSALSAPAELPQWNPAPIFEQWNTSFNPPPPPPSQTTSPAVASGDVTLAGTQPAALQQFSPPSMPIATPTMRRRSVSAVYENGLKRTWQSDRNHPASDSIS